MNREEKNPTGDPLLWKTICVSEGEIPIGRASAKHPERAAKKYNMRFENSHLSKTHAKLSIINQVLYLEDLSSTFGTIWNGHLLIPHKKVAIREGDRIGFVLNRPSNVVKDATKKAIGEAMISLETLLNPLVQLLFSIISFDPEEGSLILLPLKGLDYLADLHKEIQAKKSRGLTETDKLVGSREEETPEEKRFVFFPKTEPKPPAIEESYERRFSRQTQLKSNSGKSVKFSEETCPDNIAKTRICSPSVEIIEIKSDDHSQNRQLGFSSSNWTNETSSDESDSSESDSGESDSGECELENYPKEAASACDDCLNDSVMSDVIDCTESPPEICLLEEQHADASKPLSEVVKILTSLDKPENGEILASSSPSSAIDEVLAKSESTEQLSTNKMKKLRLLDDFFKEARKRETTEQENDETQAFEDLDFNDSDDSEVSEDSEKSVDSDNSDIEEKSIQIFLELSDNSGAEEDSLEDFQNVPELVCNAYPQDSDFETLENTSDESFSESEVVASGPLKAPVDEKSDTLEFSPVCSSDVGSNDRFFSGRTALVERGSSVDLVSEINCNTPRNRKRKHDDMQLSDICVNPEANREVPEMKKAKTRSIAKELGKGLIYVAGTLVALVAYGGYLETNGLQM